MIEALKIIVLACQISTGVNQNNINLVHEQQRKCQVELIKCVDKKDLMYYDVQLKDCLKRR